MKYVMIGACVAGLISLAGCATSAPPPATTPDGLELVRSDKHSAVYMKPDAQLDSYGKFGVVPCQVAFRKTGNVITTLPTGVARNRSSNVISIASKASWVRNAQHSSPAH